MNLGCKFYLVWLICVRRVCSRKIQLNWFFKKFWKKSKFFMCLIKNFERKVSLFPWKNKSFQVRFFFSWIFLGANVMRNFDDGKIHSLFCNNFDFNKHFFSVFGGSKYFLHYSFFLICVRPGLSNEKNYYTFFPSSHF